MKGDFKLLLVYLGFFLLSGCADLQVGPPQAEPQVGLDPTISWDAVSDNCLGQPINQAVTYNIYLVIGPGPIPTIAVDDIPCGTTVVADRSLIQPENASPISGTNHRIDLPEGTYTVAVEAVTASGNRGALSMPVTFQVRGRPQTAGGLSVGP